MAASGGDEVNDVSVPPDTEIEIAPPGVLMVIADVYCTVLSVDVEAVFGLTGRGWRHRKRCWR